MNMIQKLILACVFAAAQMGCAASFGTLFAGIQIADSQRVRGYEVKDRIRNGIPDPRVAKIIAMAKTDYKNTPIGSGNMALTLTEPAMDQFVAVFVDEFDVAGTPVPDGYYAGYVVRGERYKGSWILERIYDLQRKILKDPEPRIDYGLWAFSKFDYFENRITHRIDQEFWYDSKLFKLIKPTTSYPEYQPYIGEHRFIADALIYLHSRPEKVSFGP